MLKLTHGRMSILNKPMYKKEWFTRLMKKVYTNVNCPEVVPKESRMVRVYVSYYIYQYYFTRHGKTYEN